MSSNAVDFDDLIAERCTTDPGFRDYWERTALARAMAVAVIRDRSEHGLSQRALARQLEMPHSQIARLAQGAGKPPLEGERNQRLFQVSTSQHEVRVGGHRGIHIATTVTCRRAAHGVVRASQARRGWDYALGPGRAMSLASSGPIMAQ